MRRAMGLLVLSTVVTWAGKEKPVPGAPASAGNEKVEIIAQPFVQIEDVTRTVGAPLGPGYVVVQLKVVPKGEDQLRIDPDDFVLLSHKDGQKSGPYSPGQIAGQGALVLKSGQRGGAVMGGNPNGPMWGGIPGLGGRPRQLGQDTAAGNGAGASSIETKVEKGDAAKPNPLLETLKAKMLPVKESLEPVSGLLYFPLEGKVKTKDLELLYRGPAGRLEVEFH